MTIDAHQSGPAARIRAVLWDFGGVIVSSPFEAFARYETSLGLPVGFIRRVNATNPDTNAWARLERGEIGEDEFCERFEAEARAAGGEIDGRAVLAQLHGELRPKMVEALRRVRFAGYRTGLLTNNHARGASQGRDLSDVMALFDAVVESSTAGIRKPEPAFYLRACELLAIRPDEAVFLDDLGINLKPAAKLGMRTIKVVDPDVALADLEAVLGLALTA